MHTPSDSSHDLMLAVEGWPRRWQRRFAVHRSNESIADAYVRTLAEMTVADYGHMSGSAWKERVSGGLSHGKGPMDFPARSLVRGIIVELEHTDDPLVAMEIAMDHLVESPRYYKDLATIEDNPSVHAWQREAARRLGSA